MVGHFVRSVQAEAEADGTAETAGLLKKVMLGAYQGVRAAVETPPAGWRSRPSLPMHFRKGNIDLKLFTTIATLGIPQDITLQGFASEVSFRWTRDEPRSARLGHAQRAIEIENGAHHVT